jgi:alkylation response protein AidB-like acyl-CoA dehydrogenase
MRMLTEEQKMLLDMVREFAQEKIAPRAAEIDVTGEFPWDIKDAMAKLDLLGLAFAEEYGGTGSDLLTLCMVIEEVAKVCASSSLIVSTQSLGSLPIARRTEEALLPRPGQWQASRRLLLNRTRCRIGCRRHAHARRRRR